MGVPAAGATVTITEFPGLAGGPEGITVGPDGNLWFTEPAVDKIGKITPFGSFTEYPVAAGSLPAFITAGPDGNLWFTEENANKIGKITTSGAVTEYSGLSGPCCGPAGIAAGPDGNLWFTEHLANKIGKITTSGTLTEYSLPPGPCCSVNSNYPDLITAGPDGNLWFTETFGNKIGKITISGGVTEYPLPTSNSFPAGIAAGPDGNLWFAEPGIDKIGTITTSGSITEYSVPTSSSQTGFISGGPDGNLWFTEQFGNNIGRITPSGSITEFPVPTPNAGPLGITAGPSGTNTVWFAEQSVNKIGRVNDVAGVPAGITLSPSSASAPVGTTATFTAEVTDSAAGPLPGITVRFTVSGSVNTTGFCVTGPTGQCSFSYAGPLLPGADLITAYADANYNNSFDLGEPQASATQAWLLPAATSGQVTGGGQAPTTAGTAQIAFGFTAKSSSTGFKGVCEVVDPSANIKIHCTDVTSLVMSGNLATFFGDATINGVPTTYRIDVQDNAEPGKGTDTFRIVTAGGYSAGGVLAGGNIQLHT